jgi:hypothetical protein
MTDAALLARRLERHRAWQRQGHQLAGGDPADPRRARRLADRIAEAIDGEVVRSDGGTYVRRDGAAVASPVDRVRLASLPGQPPPDVPLVCLDTETTGLGTATGTYVFLVGVARLDGDRLLPTQLLLPDQSEERAFLAALADLVPADGWLVTYNGRGFDWPLLVTRFRMGRHDPPAHAGHLDLLPLVRRLFRHRMADARLQTVETELLAIQRRHDVGGWEIPGRYLAFLRDGSPHHLVDVVRHNAIDVASLARLLGHVADRLGDRQRWRIADAGDLGGLARLFDRHGRANEALACLDAALEGRPAQSAVGVGHSLSGDGRWWAPEAPVDFGGRPRVRRSPWRDGARFSTAWTDQRLRVERARLLRRLNRIDEAIEAWLAVAACGGSEGALAWIEVAKLREHVSRDAAGALEACERARAVLDRRRAVGAAIPRLERDVAHRMGRLRRRALRPKRAA